jgi:hypothetical protein
LGYSLLRDNPAILKDDGAMTTILASTILLAFHEGRRAAGRGGD